MTDPELRRVEPTGNPRVDALIDGLVCPSCRTIYNAAKAKCTDLWHFDNQPAEEPAILELIRRYGARRVNHEVVPNDRNAALLREMIDLVEAQINLDRAESFQRGVAEGRRQATEGYAVPEHLVGDGPCCQDCGTVNIRWYADSPLWNRVMGGPDARDDPGGIVCIRCFVIRADAAGHDPSAWRLTLPGTSLAREWGIRRPLDGVCVPYADERTAKDAAERTHRAARYGAASIVSRLVGPWEPTEQPAGERDLESYCHRCHGPNTPWSAPSPLWNAVMRGGSIVNQDEFDGIVCPTCFALLAEERGIAQLWWLSARRVHVELETVTPSGRTYDEATQRWRDAEQAGDDRG